MYMWKEDRGDLKLEAERLDQAGGGPNPSSQPPLQPLPFCIYSNFRLFTAGWYVLKMFYLQKNTKARTELQG